MKETNYRRIIRSLIRIKDELKRIEEPKLQSLIKLLQTKNIVNDDGIEMVATNKELADELSVSVAKCNLWLKELQNKIHVEFEFNPLEITEVIHEITFMRYWDEYQEGNAFLEAEKERIISLSFKLPVTPRVGEEIRIELAGDKKYSSGIVHRVDHIIIGKTQYIQVDAHPYDNEYVRWQRMRKEYEERERWRKSIRN